MISTCNVKHLFTAFEVIGSTICKCAAKVVVFPDLLIAIESRILCMKQQMITYSSQVSYNVLLADA